MSRNVDTSQGSAARTWRDCKRGEAEIQQDGDDQQSTGEHHVGTDEQPAMARRQPLLQTAISQASGTNKYPLPHTVLMRVGAAASSPSLRRSLETRPSMERSRPS